ncbi:hypothetical protein ESCAB7627_2285 [Escherichia albertii TW07627]|uniref:ShlB/FhaC/HecB family hemolysin secretion/activation protein n=1 Tax=Escherichia albertii (strain TW07627) TaxID=502347 RepID=A0ABC9NJC5_ESCAT|nr:hypothetical protein ESCAB7627_2285 [Escherichia albertii TW07627]OSL33166.1 hypothetical protein EAPG_01848 [Escherichia albertii B156]
MLLSLFTIIPFILAESKQQKNGSEGRDLSAQGPTNQI